jgi:hypothetical protein
MYDPDFPPPQHMPPQDLPVADAIATARAEYEASAEFAAMKAHFVTDRALSVLDGLAKHDAQAVGWACYDWLVINEAGTPAIDLLQGRARDDARFWSETATPAELECYTFAAVDRLLGLGGGHALFASKQIKRLAGGLFRRMSPAEKAAFKNWVEGQSNDG